VDTASSVNSAHIVETCSECHENASEQFAKIDVHPVDMHSRNPIAYIFKNIYLWMIVIVIGGMFLHNLVILFYFIRKKRKEEKQGRMVQRFRPWEVYQHVLMAGSFTILAITGFALKFPDAGWVQLLHSIGMTEFIRSTIHRIAAVTMGVISVIQLFYLLFSKNGRRDLKALVPTIDDLKNLLQNMKFHLNLTDEPAKQGRFDYAEKAEYLALIWGVAVMGATGLVLWFPEFFIHFLPAWLFETSEVIHYYEAWLATLAILVWHWFFVIYHPEIYPINLTFMDGKTTEQNLKHHHPLEYEELFEGQKEIR
jgi:cytochrome b subunit of formate dehydrogenase